MLIWLYCRSCPMTTPATKPSATSHMAVTGFSALKQADNHSENLFEKFPEKF